MNQFVSAIPETKVSNKTKTENGMPAKKSTKNACLDLFYAAGASRGKGIGDLWNNAFIEDEDIAIRILLWLRDVRGGAGERSQFRNLLNMLGATNKELAQRVIQKIPMIGRYDDFFYIENKDLKFFGFQILKEALYNPELSQLAAKWCPREKSSKPSFANEFREFLGMTPKQYRKFLVERTKVVETQMCAKEFDDIEFSKVPSLAHARYKKAFIRNSKEYKKYADSLVKGETKINASSAVYPYDIIKGWQNISSSTERYVIQAQWDAQPDYMTDKNVMSIVDVSGSMGCPIAGTTTALDVAMSLGLYTATKSKGDFRNLFITFSEKPKFHRLLESNNIVQNLISMNSADWGMRTNFESVFNLILGHALSHNIPKADMPEMLICFSDMQFDSCVSEPSNSAMQMIKQKYKEAGYEVPQIIFWNLRHGGNMPVKFSKSGVALVSGFSPSMFDALLTGDLEDMSSMNIMMKKLNDKRYDY